MPTWTYISHSLTKCIIYILHINISDKYSWRGGRLKCFLKMKTLKIYCFKRLESNVCPTSLLSILITKYFSSVQHCLSSTLFQLPLNCSPCLQDDHQNFSFPLPPEQSFQNFDVITWLPWLKTSSVTPLPTSQVQTWLAWRLRPFIFPFLDSPTPQKKIHHRSSQPSLPRIPHYITMIDTGHSSPWNVFIPRLP